LASNVACLCSLDSGQLRHGGRRAARLHWWFLSWGKSMSVLLIRSFGGPRSFVPQNFPQGVLPRTSAELKGTWLIKFVCRLTKRDT